MTRSEAQTRTELIDRQLGQSGWNVNDPTQVVEEFDILTSAPDGVAESVSKYGNHQFRDYVLLGKDGKPLAVVEAKSTRKDAAIGREQALSAFKEHLPNEPRWPNVGEKPIAGDRRIYVSTYPTMLNILRENDRKLSPHFKLNPKGKELTPQVPLPVKLVGLRIDKIETALTQNKPDIVLREAGKLKEQIRLLPQTSVVVKDAAALLSDVEKTDFWDTLAHEKLHWLRIHINPLFKTFSDADFKAMRFERDLLEYALAVLNEETTKAETLKKGIVEQISELPLSVPFVKLEESLIRSAQGNHYWSSIGDHDLDSLCDRLGPLMKFREQENPGTKQVHLNLADKLHNKEMVEFGPQHEAVSISRYRDMVEALIMELRGSHPVLQKLQNGKDVTAKEAQALAEQLHSEHPHITEGLLRQVYKNSKVRFIQFIRHILGLEVLKSFPETVSEAFEQFIQQHTTLSSRQLAFLNLLKEVMIEREAIEKKDLIHAPFTVIHPQGIRGVFSPAEIKEILSLTQRLVA